MWERNDRLPPAHPQSGTPPAIHACVLPGNLTGHLLACGMTLNPPGHTSQGVFLGSSSFYLCYLLLPSPSLTPPFLVKLKFSISMFRMTSWCRIQNDLWKQSLFQMIYKDLLIFFLRLDLYHQPISCSCSGAISTRNYYFTENLQ